MTSIRSTTKPTSLSHSPVPDELDREKTLRLGFCLRPEKEKSVKIKDLFEKQARQRPHRRRYLDHDELEAHFGAKAGELAKLAGALEKRGMKVLEQATDHRRVVVEGTISAIEKALDIELYQVRQDGHLFRSFDGPIRLPGEMASKVEQVTGLDTMPAVSPRSHSLPFSDRHYPVRRVAELYGFPVQQRGAGQTAVILMLGGGFHQQDLETYFSAIGLPVPEIEIDGVSGAGNAPASSQLIRELFKAQGFDTAPTAASGQPEAGATDMSAAVWTVEATTDLEILGSLLPEAKIVMLFAANTQDGQAAAMGRALSPEFEKKYGRPSVISCSWGQDESSMRASSRHLMETQLQRAAALGVTVCCASGDSGGGFVDYPAASPHALACGGTAITTPPAEATAHNLQEEVWREKRLERYFSATGGGLSSAFEAPTWQASAVKPWGGGKRGLPDLATQASLATGYALVIGGVRVGMGGTSAAAPLVAGLVGQINGANADLAKGYRVGWLTPVLYGADFAAAFKQVVDGSNGLYCGTDTWDPCTGLGRPIGDKLLALLRRDAPAGTSKG